MQDMMYAHTDAVAAAGRGGAVLEASNACGVDGKGQVKDHAIDLPLLYSCAKRRLLYAAVDAAPDAQMTQCVAVDCWRDVCYALVKVDRSRRMATEMRDARIAARPCE